MRELMAVLQSYPIGFDKVSHHIDRVLLGYMLYTT